MFQWNDASIEYLKTASEYGDFNRILAKHAAKYFCKNAAVLDAGCGLGYLSLALAPYVGSVTGADVSEAALNVLRENIAKSSTANVSARRLDVFHLPKEMQFDGMVFCFCGGTLETLKAIRAHCRGKAVLFKKNWATHRFTLRNVAIGRHTFAVTVAELNTFGVPFESEIFSVDMGQPFRSLADAVDFYRLHSRESGPETISESDVLEKLTATGKADYPYYLPADRPLGMLVIDAGDIPDSIESIAHEKEIYS